MQCNYALCFVILDLRYMISAQLDEEEVFASAETELEALAIAEDFGSRGVKSKYPIAVGRRGRSGTSHV
jgi:hypothetical protein